MVGTRSSVRSPASNSRRNSQSEKEISQTSSQPQRTQEQLRALAEELVVTEISFVDHMQFRRKSAERWIDEQQPAKSVSEVRGTNSSIGLAFVSGLVQAPLLKPAEESYLFLRMNFVKYRAEQLRRRINCQRPDAAQLDQIQVWLTEAAALRNRIVEANLRLVVSVASKLSRSLDQLSELTSEGLLPLMRAVELFDVQLGFRFSTYATWAIRNQIHRCLKRQRGPSELLRFGDDSDWNHIPDRRGSGTRDLQLQQQREELLSELIGTLNPRERTIIAARFGLDGQPAGQSLAEISVVLGLSKERVRQLALGALEKLREQATHTAIELPEAWRAEA
ncbi:sigma-70 family RNA polymerase sigma factor [bacterium]|nr:sigma-70 family RNA polymerase sigma factor [bacterium]